MPYYDPRIVPAHGSSDSSVFLINEAPGPSEAHHQIPSVGDQGGNIYRALRRAHINWAFEFVSFSWPKKIIEQYANQQAKQREFELRDAFLEIRAMYMTCTNSYNLWPKSGPDLFDFVKPSFQDVTSPINIERLKNEIPPNHRVILICGEYAWLACFGSMLNNPASHEGRSLSRVELQRINQRFSSSFVSGWYMGHTRRWSLNTQKISTVLKKVDIDAKWPCCKCG